MHENTTVSSVIFQIVVSLCLSETFRVPLGFPSVEQLNLMLSKEHGPVTVEATVRVLKGGYERVLL